MTPKWQARAFVFALLALCGLPLVIAAQSPFIEAFFEPFAYLDIERIYETYHAIIDFLLFTLIFTSVAQATLGKRFGGRPGRAVSVGIGLAMGLSLAITEAALGFSLRSLGPVAVLVLGSVSILFLYRTTRTLGLARTPAIFLTLLSGYLLLGGLSPDVIDWAVRYHIIGWIHFVLLVLLIWALVAFSTGSGFQSLKGKIPSFETLPSKDILATQAQEKQLIQKKLGVETKKEQKEVAVVHDMLCRIQNAVEKKGHLREVRENAVSELRTISSRAQELQTRLSYLKSLIQKTEKLDEEVIAKLKSRHGILSAEEEAKIRNELKAERKKIRIEEKLERIQKLTAAYGYNLQEAVKHGAQYLANNQVEIALGWIKRAIKYEQAAGRLFKAMEHLESRILKLTKKAMAMAQMEKRE